MLKRNLRDFRQGQLIDECLKYWKLPTYERVDYADDRQLEEIRQMPKFKQQRAKISYAPMHYYRLLERFDNELRNSVKLKDTINQTFFFYFI